MEKIKKDFILGEFRRLALCAAGFAICLFILMRFSPQLAAYQPLPWLAVAAILVLAGLRSVMLARTGISICWKRNIWRTIRSTGSGKGKFTCCQALSSAGTGAGCFSSPSIKLNGWNAGLTALV